MNVVHQRQADRLRLLLALYEAVDADTMQRVNYKTLAAEIALDGEDARRAAQYLVDEGLAKWAAMGGSMAIEHWGIKEAEDALREQPTEHFDPPVINVVVVEGGGTIGNIQQGTTDSKQG